MTLGFIGTFSRISELLNFLFDFYRHVVWTSSWSKIKGVGGNLIEEDPSHIVAREALLSRFA